MLVFSAFVALYAWRTRNHPALTSGDRSARHRRAILIGAMSATGFLVIRAIYRTVELAQGWGGYLLSHEGYFIGLDAVMSTAAMICLAAGHPGLFPEAFADDAELSRPTTPLKHEEKQNSFTSSAASV